MPWLKRSHQAYQPTIGGILFLFIAFVLGSGALGWGWVEFVWLHQAGVAVQGEVVALNQTPKGVRSIIYQFEVTTANGERERWERGRMVSQPLANNYAVGDPITILYLSTWPEISNIQGNRFVLIGDIWLATVVMGLVDGVLGVFLFFNIKEWRANRHQRSHHV
jgi:hypothetical protein